MKTKVFLSSFVLLTLLFTTAAFPLVNKPVPTEDEKYAAIEANLLVGLNSDNEGLRVSCAYYLGEMRSKKAVNQLMRLLRMDESTAVRTVAALSLIKIEDPQGLFLVKREALFNDQEKIRQICGKFYNAYILECCDTTTSTFLKSIYLSKK